MSGDEDRLEAWAALALAAWTSSAPWLGLLSRFDGDARVVVRADDDALVLAGARTAAIQALRSAREQAPGVVECVRRHGLNMTAIDSADYPILLRHVPDPPLVLYWRGSPPAACDPAVAIVGSRRCSEYGLRTASRLARELAAAGSVVVSGLARGIDASAHRGALAGGRTAAVMAGGLDRIYPSEHTELAMRIVESGGCLLSEQPPGRRPIARMFPYRNRIITGLARATIVVEAGHRSGSLASARHALAQGRDVYAVPGPIDSPYSLGTNALAQEGCYLLTEARDLSATSGVPVPLLADAPRPGKSVSDFGCLMDAGARSIVGLLQRGPRDLDGLVEVTALDGGRVLALLTALEMDGLVERGWSGNYSCTHLASSLRLPEAAPRAPQHP
ncbi:MAG TPA: DNA-processing protein DprA [Candidatus Binatia bacterium]|nr:DNA-processing protein DprA [Candidatus Binatia bacterium]